jgi:acetyl esterase/lipase
VRLSWRVRVFDQVLQRGGYRISEARTPQDIERIRARGRASEGSLPAALMAALLAPIVRWVFGRARPDVATEDRTIPGPAGQIPVRLYRPPHGRGDVPLVIHLHGGGWVLGDLDGGAPLCTAVAAGVGAVVASIDYRLAPEHPAPAAVDDCIAATRWLAAHAAEVGAAGPIAVMGDSAGGNLAALVAIAARDDGAPRIAAQALVYPSVDLTMSFPSVSALAGAPLLTRADMLAFRRHYLGHDRGTDDPALSPWFVEDLDGLAPALVQTAEHDPLRDEGRAWAERLVRAGVPTRHTEYVGVPHGFLSFPGLARSSAGQATAEIVQFLRRQLT